MCSVNFVTAHDGFTLADLTSYDEKHNEANGEENRDGESNNTSFNCGAEGPTDDPEVNGLRLRQRKNLLATLLLSTGVPMLLGGDELGRTQGGNNNAYCQDNEISWYDWDAVDLDLLEFTQLLTKLRREEPALRPPWYRYAPAPGVTDVVLIRRSDDQDFAEADWDNPDARTITFVLEHAGADAFALLLNSAENGVEFQVPEAPNGEWELAISSDPDQQVTGEVTTLIVRDASFTLLRSPRMIVSGAGAPGGASVSSSADQRLLPHPSTAGRRERDQRGHHHVDSGDGEHGREDEHGERRGRRLGEQRQRQRCGRDAQRAERHGDEDHGEGARDARRGEPEQEDGEDADGGDVERAECGTCRSLRTDPWSWR